MSDRIPPEDLTLLADEIAKLAHERRSPLDRAKPVAWSFKEEGEVRVAYAEGAGEWYFVLLNEDGWVIRELLLVPDPARLEWAVSAKLKYQQLPIPATDLWSVGVLQALDYESDEGNWSGLCKLMRFGQELLARSRDLRDESALR